MGRSFSGLNAQPAHNKSLHWPPIDSAHVVCHTSCNGKLIASHEVLQLPGASELNIRHHWRLRLVGALLTFLVLFGLIKLFERDRDDLENFTIGTVAVVPVLAAILIKVVIGLLYPDPIVLLVVPPVLLIALTFILLWKNLEIPVARSILYTIVVVIFNEGLGFLLASG